MIDGQLDEPDWRQAAWSANLINVLGPGEPSPPYRTRCKALWDDQNLYIAAELEDPDVRARMTERGSPIFRENCFECFLDPLGQGRNYWEIEINARNTIWDLQVSRPFDQGGHRIPQAALAGIQTAVHVDGTLNYSDDVDRGWIVEVAIPFADLKSTGCRLPPHAGDVWRINFNRMIYPDGRIQPDGDPFCASWTPMGEINFHQPEKYGRLCFQD